MPTVRRPSETECPQTTSVKEGLVTTITILMIWSTVMPIIIMTIVQSG